MGSKAYSVKDSHAFVETFTLPSYRTGPLDGMTFAVKDNIEIAGTRTSYGSKSWQDTHPDAVHNALCVEQLLGAGASCIGKTVADEFTYSLTGENPFFGTPLNPGAPDHVPGGSSSGSASAVACGICDFAIGTDSAGSIRVPASFCGIWGMRPTLHRISEAGILPFMPSVSTVGAFANTIDVLGKVMRVLLRSRPKPFGGINNIFLLEDAFSVADPAVRAAIENSICNLSCAHGVTVSKVSANDIFGSDYDLIAANERALRILQTAEFASTVGSWIDTVEADVSPGFALAYQNVQHQDRSTVNEALDLCEYLFARILDFMGPDDLICTPTTPSPAPLKASMTSAVQFQNFYDRTMALTSFAGVGRAPEISIPAASVDGLPVGVSLIARHYEDEFLLEAAKVLFAPDCERQPD
ncbi:amidase family protein [Pararhizobium sp. IMCC21322]|uniref:amidase family protein n=1 Tax=Pararhizobium sp. IMCC21322 TaxID=3067903 RepID=UPI002740ED9A|nr:amidase family protein [Pararhizobium sp. IMCC21322]